MPLWSKLLLDKGAEVTGDPLLPFWGELKSYLYDFTSDASELVANQL